MVKWIITVWKNKVHILKGFWNNIFRNNYIERVSAERLAICAYCPDIDLDGKKCMMPGTNPCCGKCGCSLALKTRDLSSGCGDLETPRWHPVESRNHGRTE